MCEFERRGRRPWKRTSLAAALALLAGGSLSPARAEAPAAGSQEGELLCLGVTSTLASGALLTTGADPLAAATARGVFLGRLSVIAPDARFRLQAFLDAYDKMTPDEQGQLLESCFAKLKDAQAIAGGGPDAKVR